MESLTSIPSQQSEATGESHVHAEIRTNDFQEAGKYAMRAADEEVQSCSKTIAAYLMDRVEEFRELSELRQKVRPATTPTSCR